MDAFVADASEAVFEQHIPAPVDMATLIFVLSAINPSKWRRTLKNIRKVSVVARKTTVLYLNIQLTCRYRINNSKIVDFIHSTKVNAWFADADSISCLFTVVTGGT